MQKALLRSVAVLGIVLVAGCASSLRVQYSSDPPGATLYEEGRPVGTTPLVLNYKPDESFKRGSCMRLKGTSVKWASGAQASIGYLTACPAQGSRQQYTFVRPDVPGREIDMNFAIQLDRNMAMRQQARAQSAAAAAQLMQATRPQPVLVPAPLLTPTINCRSTQYGLTVHTRCQ